MKNKIISFMVNEIDPMTRCIKCGFVDRESKLKMDESYEHYCPSCGTGVETKGVHPERVKVLNKLMRYLDIEKEVGRLLFND